MSRLLLVEDDAKLALMLGRGFEEEGFQVETEADGDAGLRRLLGGPFDVCILDVLLPGLDGFRVLESAREQGVRTPIVMLTARDAVPDRVHGLNLGADDYLVKPFVFAELLARIQAVLRRGPTQDRPAQKDSQLTCGPLRLDPDSHRVWRGQEELELSLRQFNLLEFLMRNRGQVVSRAMILKAIWGYDFSTGTNVVDVHIANLRQRVDVPGKPSLIHTVRGVGYRIDDDRPDDRAGAKADDRPDDGLDDRGDEKAEDLHGEDA